MMVSSAIESEWIITLSRIVCLDIHISTPLTVCSSVNVIRVWFGILPLISSSLYLMKHAQAAVLFAWEENIGVEVDSWFAGCTKVGNIDGGWYCCAFMIDFLLDGVLYHYFNWWF